MVSFKAITVLLISSLILNLLDVKSSKGSVVLECIDKNSSLRKEKDKDCVSIE